MKLCLISDTHGYHNDIDFTDYADCDTLVFAGDLTRTIRNQQEEIVNFLRWLAVTPFKNKVMIAGNHELYIRDNMNWFYEQLASYPSITYLHNSSTTIEGINFFGAPYSNEFRNWAFMEQEPGLSAIWDTIPDDTQVLITHGPAYKHLDKVVRSYGSNPYVGSQSLTHRKRHLPDLQLHICGHIHEDSGTMEVDTHTVINASVVDERYNHVHKPYTYQIE